MRVLNIARSVVGHLADRRAGHQQHAEQHTDEQQRRGDPLRQPVRQRPADGEAEEAGGVLAAGGCPGEPDHRCHSPSAGSVIIAAPRISRGRASGSGSVRISTTAIAISAMRQQQRRPTRSASAGSRRSSRRPDGRRRTTSWRRSRPRCPAAPARSRRGGDRASMSRARPTERAVDAGAPGEHQPAGAGTAADGQPGRRGWRDGLRRLAGFRRGAGRGPDREPAFDLLERAPERAAVLLGMAASLVATAPYSPSATRVTIRSRNLVRFTE